MSAQVGNSLGPEDYERHSRWLRHLARSLVADAGAAEDLVQETWLAWLRRGPTGALRGGEGDRDAARPWLRRVLTNAAKKLHRGDGRRAAREALAVEEPQPVASAAELAESADLIHALMGEVRELDEPLRSAVLLRYLHGLSAAEIARRSGEPEGTVRWRLSEARERLRDRMDEKAGSRDAWAALTLPFGRELIGAGPSFTGAATSATAAGSGAKGGHTALLALAAVCATGVVGVWMAAQRTDPGEAAGLAVANRVERAASTELSSPLDGDERRRSGAARANDLPALSTVTPTEAPTLRPHIDSGQAALVVRFVGPASEPIHGAVLRQVGNDDAFTMADEAGNAILVFRPPVKSAPLSFCVECRGYASLQFSASIQTGVVTPLGTMTLAASLARTGRVVDGEGRPVADAIVYLAEADDLDHPQRGRFADSGPPAWGDFGSLIVRADGRGRFQFDRAPVAPTRIWAAAAGYRYTVTPVLAEDSSEPIEVELRPLPPHLRITGRVVDAQGRPLGDVLVTLRSSQGGAGERVEAETKPDGTFQLLPRRRGPFRIVVEDLLDRYDDAAMEAVVAGAAGVEVRMTVPL